MADPLRGAVLGHPIGHSKSPALHNAAYAALGADLSYSAIDVQESGMADFLAQVRAEKNWYGLSVTMPLKNVAVELMDELTPTARALGAVNTIVCTQTPAGVAHLRGENTDVAGLVNALRHAGVVERPRAAILGGGGTAVSAVAALVQLGAPEITVFVRTLAKGGEVQAVAAALGVSLSLELFDGAPGALAGFDVVISTLPPRAADATAHAFTGQGTAVKRAVLLDAAYDPWPSALAQAWERSGGVVVAGIEMLLYQGVEQVKLFTVAAGYSALDAEQVGDVMDVMCDAIGVHRRDPHEQNMAG